MSKIEKALSKARRDRGLALVPVTSPAAPSSSAAEPSGQELQRVDHGTDVAPRVAATAAIARMREPRVHSGRDLAEQHLISADIGDSGTVQAFREIRTRILQRTQGRNGIILVTSVTGGSGNSFVAMNLGVAFALDAGRTALVVDCNLRSPSTHRLFGDSGRLGITDYFTNPELGVAEIIHPVGIERLRVIPVGGNRGVQMECFTAQHVQRLMAEIRSRYSERFVILDAPPMTASADTQILSELCDHVLVVVPYGRATHAQIDASIKSLDSRKLLGVVFNNEPQLPPLESEWGRLPRWLHVGLRRAFARLRRGLGRRMGVDKNASTAR